MMVLPYVVGLKLQDDQIISYTCDLKHVFCKTNILHCFENILLLLKKKNMRILRKQTLLSICLSVSLSLPPSLTLIETKKSFCE